MVVKQSDMSMFDLFDHATTIVLVHTLVHVHWIGVGVILESLLFPNDPSTAIIANMALGYVTCSALLASQDRLVATAQGLEAAGNRKLHVLFEDAVIVAANTASIFLWNGMWSIFDVTFVPDDTSYLLVQVRVCRKFHADLTVSVSSVTTENRTHATHLHNRGRRTFLYTLRHAANYKKNCDDVALYHRPHVVDLGSQCSLTSHLHTHQP